MDEETREMVEETAEIGTAAFKRTLERMAEDPGFYDLLGKHYRLTFDALEKNGFTGEQAIMIMSPNFPTGSHR